MKCAHCEHSLRVTRSMLLPRWDGGTRCNACDRLSYVRDEERIKRTFLPYMLGMMPFILGNAILHEFIGWWSLLVSGVIGLPIFLGAFIWAYGRCETVPDLPASVLKRRTILTKSAAAGMFAMIVFLLLGLLGIGNLIAVLIGFFLMLLIIGALGWATLFHNLNEGG